MIYSDAEIRENWRKAGNKENQVQVLAELNNVSMEDMNNKLVELGLLSEPVRSKTPFDESRALSLHAEGLCDFDIAEMLGVGVQTFSVWRREHDLPVNRKRSPGSGTQPGSRKKAKPKNPKIDEETPSTLTIEKPMTLRELLRILQILEAGHPEAIVWCGPRMLQAVAFHAELDRDGKTAHAVVELIDGGNLRAE